MLQTSAELQENWKAKLRSRMGRPAEKPSEKSNVEVLALLCPDWRNAMFVLDAEALTVAYANVRAIEMFKRRYPMQVSRGRLELGSSNGTERFHMALQQVLQSESGRASIVIDDEQHGLTCSIRICLPQGFMREVLHRNIGGGGRLVVIEVASGSMAVSPGDLEALGVAFGLTSAETTILALLGQGRSLLEIAALRRVGLETVRHQCKQLLSKTRSRRQSDLVKLVVALCAHDSPIAAEQDQVHA